MDFSGLGPSAVQPSLIERAILRREILPWALLGVTLGLVEGATAAVLVKETFAGAASPTSVNVAVSLVSGAPAMANVVSFAWANIAHGRARVQLVVALQALFALFVGLVGLAPSAAGGLVFAVMSILLARTLWAGVLTVRASVWISNYPRRVLARITGRIVTLSSLTVAASAALAATVLGTGRVEARWLYGLASLCGLLAAWLYRHTRVRREFQLLQAETRVLRRSEPFSLAMLRQILREDPDYRSYMSWMAIYGAGNLMLVPILVVLMTDHLGIPAAQQIALLSVVPLAALPLAIPAWARLFEGVHIVEYRALQSWAMVAAMVLLFCPAFFGWPNLLWLGAVALGAALAGANLGWNLGHNDFAQPGRAQHYMGVHVTLTGVRGMFAPSIGILCYELLESWHAGSGRFALLLPFTLTVAGAFGFGLQAEQLRARGALVQSQKKYKP
ncbi:MAG: hypothetical protein R3E77_09245 [Steroidobacteraceae bacterium]